MPETPQYIALTTKINFDAKVSFKNGDTTRQQTFEADNFPSLVSKVEEFLKAL